MWTRIKNSLTLRIFLITCGLMLAACMATYAAISMLTPLSYTDILTDELRQKTDALILHLAECLPDECADLLSEFSRETGADLLLLDESGHVLYGDLTLQTVTYTDSADSDVATASEQGSIWDMRIEDVLFEGSQWAAESNAEQEVSLSDPSLQLGAAMNADVEQRFSFQNGTQGRLYATGGKKAVNQAAEAMKRTLPWLALLILLLSLFSSFFYARWITRPIVHISRIAKHIAAQDFSVRWQKKRADEIGSLGENLNILSDNLSSALADLRSANCRLQQDIDHERKMEQQRSAFFSAASHELKTPVTILKGQLSGMLAQIGVYQDREKYLARALEVTGRMENLIREILTISRIEAGSFALAANEADLSQLLSQQLAADAELIEQKEMRLEAHIASGVCLRGNPNLLAKALDNVLMNAILYSPRQANIRVTLDPYVLVVENSGVSIPEEALPQLFTPFYRLEGSRSRRSGGSGLGLYLVKSIFDLHGVPCEMKNTASGVAFIARLR